MKMYMVALVVVVGVLGGFYGGYKVGQNNVSANTSTGTRGTTGGSANGFTENAADGRHVTYVARADKPKELAARFEKLPPAKL